MRRAEVELQTSLLKMKPFRKSLKRLVEGFRIGRQFAPQNVLYSVAKLATDGTPISAGRRSHNGLICERALTVWREVQQTRRSCRDESLNEKPPMK